MLLETLKQYGFSDKEAKVYLAGLELGSAPASTIARHAGENRGTVYSILKELIKKGIAQEIQRDELSYFSVITPTILFKNLEDKYTIFKEKLPEFMALAEKMWSKPKVQFYEWVEGIKAIYNDLLNSETEISSFLWVEDIHPEVLEYLEEDFLHERKAKKIFAKVILAANIHSKGYLWKDKKWFKESKIIDDIWFSMDGEINLYWPNKVSIILFDKKEMSGLLITSDRLYHTLKNIFDLLRKTF